MTKARAKPFSASLESRKRMEREGWTVANVEHRIPKTFITRDLYGFADLIAMSPSRGIMLIQVTGGTGASNFHARLRKVKASAEAAIWLASGGRIQVHSWEKVGKRDVTTPKDQIVRGRWCRVFEVQSETEACGDCDPCIGGRPDQCAVCPGGAP